MKSGCEKLRSQVGVVRRRRRLLLALATLPGHTDGGHGEDQRRIVSDRTSHLLVVGRAALDPSADDHHLSVGQERTAGAGHPLTDDLRHAPRACATR